jgi:molybdenum cofactor synthesis domain-containing protein
LVREISQYRPVREALREALACLASPQEELVKTRKAFGRVAAESVASRADVPPYSTAHMDGFAIRSSDTAGASAEKPARFVVAGTARVGDRRTGRLGSHQAVRVSTGSFVPAGADAVVPVEQVEVAGRRLRMTREVPLGSFVFNAGEDVKRGRLVVRKGDVIRAQEVGVLVSMGVSKVRVWRRPRVAVLATGNELTDSMSLRTSKTRNSHGPLFLSMARAVGCDVFELGIARDRVKAILARVASGLKVADLVLMTGGTSVGKLDLAEEVIARLEPRAMSHGLRMDRGRVAGLAVVGGKGIVMMPGPIQGAMNAFVLLGLPMIEKLSGRTDTAIKVRARLTRRWEARKKFPNFTKVVYLKVVQSRTGAAAEPLSAETESMSLLTESNAYAVVPEDVTSIEAGREIEANLLPGFSFS